MLPLLQWRILVAWSYRPSDHHTDCWVGRLHIMLDFRQAAMVTQYNKNLFDGTDEKDTEAGSAQQSSLLMEVEALMVLRSPI